MPLHSHRCIETSCTESFSPPTTARSSYNPKSFVIAARPVIRQFAQKYVAAMWKRGRRYDRTVHNMRAR